jgi:hypothetical protein
LKKAFITPDFDQKLTSVHTRSQLYGSALQAGVIREKQHEDILEWISPKDKTSITPKRLNEVVDTHLSFVRSTEYLNWVGEGPSTLICSGHRTSFKGVSNEIKLVLESPISCTILFSKHV